MRLDYFYRSVEEGDEKEKEHEFALGFEYAFHPSFSIETEIPYTIIDPEEESSESDIGSISLGLKFANYAFAEHNLLLGYGIEFALPTGNDEKGIGSNHIWEVEPFFSLGYKTGKVELITFLIFGIPFNQDEGEEVETEFSYQVSGLYHVHPRVRALLELDGTTVLSGHEEGDNVVNLSPGILLQPLSDPNLVLGLGASFPVSDLQEFDWGLNTSVFYHF